MSSKSKVYFFYEKSGFGLTQREYLKVFIGELFKKEKKALLNLNYIFCSDKRLLEINKQYLNHDYYTDIITFDLSETNETIGEIYISIDRVKDNAKINGTSFRSELHRVIFHGALHLCGYGDKKPKEKALMTEKENKYLSLYGIK